MDDSDLERIPDPETEGLADILGAALGEEFAGYPIRVDAGERGRVWVALADAEGDEEARRVTVERLDEKLSEMDLSERGISYRLSSAPSAGNLVLVCEFFAEDSDSV